jgi:hypothetical protein
MGGLSEASLNESIKSTLCISRDTHKKNQ